jgi:hypothetical protein
MGTIRINNEGVHALAFGSESGVLNHGTVNIGLMGGGIITRVPSNHGLVDTSYTPNSDLTPEAMARIVADSPELQAMLSQINNIATDSQQEQHIIF